MAEKIKLKKAAVFQHKHLGAAILVVIGLLGLLAGLGAFAAARAVALSWGGPITGAGPGIAANNTRASLLNEQGTPVPGAAIPSNPNAPASAPSLAQWDGAGRVTVLLMGLDYRDWEAGQGPSRSDTMVLLTLDPLNKTAGMLSIPRDMWVPIPGFKHGKINTAYYLGEAYKLPGGGPGLAVKTVEQFLGIPINYYAQVDFEAFIKFVDEIGGVKINVPATIKIDPLGKGNTKTLKPGVQVLPGNLALAYARERHTDGGDFDRAERTQQVIMGIRDRVLSVNMLPVLTTKAPTLYQQLAAGIHTNLSVDEVIKLALLAQSVPPENIQQGILGKDQVVFGWSPDRLSILIPIPDKIHEVRDKIFAAGGALGPETPGSAQEQMAAEGARLAVLNGSSSSGLASRTAAALREAGANVSQNGDASKPYSLTVLVDHTGSPYTLKYLAEWMKLPDGRVRLDYDPQSPVDVEVILGNDWAANNSLP